MSGRVAVLVIISHLVLVSCEEDPCSPNPCGENTRCTSTRVNESPVISCECHLGFEVPEGGDPFDGCVEKKERKPGTQGSQGRPVEEGEEAVSTTTPPPPAIQPLTTVRTTDRSGGQEQLENRLQEGRRPTFLLPRRPVESPIIPPNTIEDVDTPDKFPEECLVHEDCAESDYCSPPPENKCIDACTLDVCGAGAICLGQLHRPVCVCPDGYDGNPYDKCAKTPSRVGMKFRK